MPKLCVQRVGYAEHLPSSWEAGTLVHTGHRVPCDQPPVKIVVNRNAHMLSQLRAREVSASCP